MDPSVGVVASEPSSSVFRVVRSTSLSPVQETFCISSSSFPCVSKHALSFDGCDGDLGDSMLEVGHAGRLSLSMARSVCLFVVFVLTTRFFVFCLFGLSFVSTALSRFCLRTDSDPTHILKIFLKSVKEDEQLTIV